MAIISIAGLVMQSRRLRRGSSISLKMQVIVRSLYIKGRAESARRERASNASFIANMKPDEAMQVLNCPGCGVRKPGIVLAWCGQSAASVVGRQGALMSGGRSGHAPLACGTKRCKRHGGKRQGTWLGDYRHASADKHVFVVTIAFAEVAEIRRH